MIGKKRIACDANKHKDSKRLMRKTHLSMEKIEKEKNMEDLCSLKKTPELLFHQLYEIKYEQNNVSSEIRSFFTDNDIFKLAEEAINRDCEIYQVEVVVEKIGIVRFFNIDTFISYIKALHKNNKDYYPCCLDSIFSKIATDYPAEALLLREEIKKLDYSFVPQGILLLVNDNSKLSVDEKYEYALTLVNSNIETQYMAGYVIIEKCICNACFSKKQDAINLFHSAIKSKKDKELHAIVRPACNLSLREATLQDDIFFLRKINDPYINNNISIFLFQNSKNVASSEYLCKLLLSFTSIQCEFKGIIKNIDFVLMDLAASSFNLCIDFITKWIEDSDYKKSSNSFDEIWNSFCSDLNFINQSFIIYTRFLLNDNSLYHKAVAEIIHGLIIHKNYSFHFDKDIIEKSNKEDIIFLCRKLLGNIYDIKTLCELFDSILQIKINDEEITNIIINIFFRLASEYRLPVLQYFKEKQLSEDNNLNQVYNRIIPDLERICEINTKKKQFPELAATYEQRTAVAKKNSEDDEELMNIANSKSVIMRLIKPVKLLYGQGFSYNLNDSSKSITSNFARYEESFYLSKKDIFCPVHSEMERFFFRIAKRGAK